MGSVEKQETDVSVEDFEWNVDNETHLFMAMSELKLAGINKYFHMIEVVEKFSNLVGKEVSTAVIWKHLDTLYDMKMCDEIEGIPFPNDVKEFSLPEVEYGPLMKMKSKAPPPPIVEEVKVEAERPPSPKVQTTPRSTSRGAPSKDNATPKVSKKDQQIEKSAKKEPETPISTPRPVTPAVETPVSSKASEKESAKADPRRDSKDSNASSKESGSVKGGVTSSTTKTPKEGKGTKAKRDSNAGSDKSEELAKPSEDQGSIKRGTKRPLRGSLKPEEQPTPPGRRRRI